MWPRPAKEETGAASFRLSCVDAAFYKLSYLCVVVEGVGMRETWRGMYSHMDTIDAVDLEVRPGRTRSGSSANQPTKRRAVIVVIVLIL